ncbi:protein kinase family protein [Bacillus sp. 03113]|uniref:protein kinase family protein n=1 Tax=Bacillus sp. 03113 TaxID=2578211 RepID=UPI0011425FCC|nr:protein kinase family protein [Bacillus sp. 03113]
MNRYRDLAVSVKIKYKRKRAILIDASDQLQYIGEGRSAYVFRIKYTKKALKVFFPPFTRLAKIEAGIYQMLKGINYFPAVYESGGNYIVMDVIEGKTLFECLSEGIPIPENRIAEIDNALKMAKDRGLNPSDIHLRNIFLTSSGEIKVVDVARFTQKKKDTQWQDLKKAYYKTYVKPYFPKKIPVPVLNTIAFIYKRIKA